MLRAILRFPFVMFPWSNHWKDFGCQFPTTVRDFVKSPSRKLHLQSKNAEGRPDTLYVSILTCVLIQAEPSASVRAASPSLVARSPPSAALASSRLQASVHADDPVTFMRSPPLGAAQPVLPAAVRGPPGKRMSKARQKLLADQAAREAGLAAQEAAEEAGDIIHL